MCRAPRGSFCGLDSIVMRVCLLLFLQSASDELDEIRHSWTLRQIPAWVLWVVLVYLISIDPEIPVKGDIPVTEQFALLRGNAGAHSGKTDDPQWISRKKLICVRRTDARCPGHSDSVRQVCILRDRFLVCDASQLFRHSDLHWELRAALRVFLHRVDHDDRNINLRWNAKDSRNRLRVRRCSKCGNATRHDDGERR